MPNLQAQPVPTPATITPALLKTHSITPDEYRSIVQKLNRTPSLTELGIFSVMWSEHCSYKSSRVHLKRLPTKGPRTDGPGAVLQGPGENAGIIDVGDGWACAFKIESHNHPSYIEPYQGAATGVGGILRDIFTMGARPLAVMDSLRFGPLQKPVDSEGKLVVGSDNDQPPTTNHQLPTVPDFARNRHTMAGVVHGVGGYGNCFGVPNLGGETRFEDCYSGNPLVNAFALGLVRKDEIFYAAAHGVGNPVFYVGARTGRDGIHGATMASEEFTEGSDQKRPNVQMGDPFLEKLLLEACLEVMQTGAVLGIQDMGAAGLTCSTCEMGARGQLGVTIELDRVPQRETGMSSYEIMLSESQERMLLVAAKGREAEVVAVFTKWGLDCAEVGIVTADDVMRVFHGGVLQAEIPNRALTDEAPLYHRPVGVWKSPVPLDPPAWVLEELQKPRDYTADLKKLLASPNICSKKWIYEQYDSMVQTNTVQGPGSEAGVIRIKGTGYPSSGSQNHGVPHDHRSEAEVIVGAGSSATTAPPAFIGVSGLAAPAENLSPAAAEHSILGQIVNFIAGSTPEAEATLLTGNLDAANPVVGPGPEHRTGLPGSAAGSPLPSTVEAGGFSPLNQPAPPRGFSPAAPKPERGLAMALAGNGRWCYLDPKLGAMHAVAEAARKVACTGATPVAATNCLNFGNPEKPEIMAQLSAAIDGIAEACTALGTPVTGGNVSLYNETRGEGIYPTPVIGVVGILDDVSKAVPSKFSRWNDDILLIHFAGRLRADYQLQELGSSAFASVMFGELWGTPPEIDLAREAELHRLLCALSKAGLLNSASDISDGGLATALAKACFGTNFGAFIYPPKIEDSTAVDELGLLFGEHGSTVLVTCSQENRNALEELVREHGDLTASDLGNVVMADQIDNDPNFTVWCNDRELISANHWRELETPYATALESQLAEEVLA